jgi:hypothetical protein
MTYDVHLADTFQKSIKALKKKYPPVFEGITRFTLPSGIEITFTGFAHVSELRILRSGARITLGAPVNSMGYE